MPKMVERAIAASRHFNCCHCRSTSAYGLLPKEAESSHITAILHEN